MRLCVVDSTIWSYPTCRVDSMRAGPVGCISYNMYVLVDAPLVTLCASGVGNG